MPLTGPYPLDVTFTDYNKIHRTQTSQMVSVVFAVFLLRPQVISNRRYYLRKREQKKDKMGTN